MCSKKTLISVIIVFNTVDLITCIQYTVYVRVLVVPF